MTLRETIEQVRSMQESLSDSEEAAKIKIILPILRALGWDCEGNEVDYEYPLANGGDKPDIVLLHRSQPVAFVEAKKSGANLGTPSQVDQIRRYFIKSDAKICTLTNGVDWWFYLARGAEGDDEFKFAELSLIEDPLDELEEDLVMFLSRNNLIKRRAEAATKQALKILRARLGAGLQQEKLQRIWNAMIERASIGSLDNELVHLFRKEVYRKLALRPTPEQFAALLQEQGRTEGPGSPPPLAPTPSRPSSKPPSDPMPSAASAHQLPANPVSEDLAGSDHSLENGERLVPSSAPLPDKKPIASILWNERLPGQPYYEIPVAVAEAICRHYPVDFLRVEKLGGSIISQDPTAFRARQVADSGWFVDVGHKGKKHIKDARRLLECCGHDPDELKLIYEGVDT